MSLNANQKGKRFELKIAKDLAKKFDTNIRRTPNSGGLSIKGDIMTTSGILSEYCLLYTSPSPRDRTRSRMPSSA